MDSLKSRKALICMGLVFLFLAVQSCKTKEYETVVPSPEAPFNPFDTLTYNHNNVPPIEVDSASILGLHTYIFSVSCNQPGCHDGSFEPDFRTVMSTYNSLVLHEIKKNYPVDPLPYRVTPGDASKSMIYHRTTMHNPPNFELMPSSGNPLPTHLTDKIAEWINDGAKDLYGNDPMLLSYQPSSLGLVATLPNNGDFRIDTIRGNRFYNPFMAPTNDEIDLYFCYIDALPAGDTIFGYTLSYNKIAISEDVNDFSNATELNLQVLNIATAPQIGSYFGLPIGFPLPYTHKVTIRPSDYGFTNGDIVYMRTYVQDIDHPDPIEIPEDDSQYYIQTYFSMQLQ